jgi:catechol 2,3-dioxygenase
MERMMTFTTDAGTKVGHIHLRVADLDRAVAFYTEVMGFELQQIYGDQAAFLSAGDYHHHIGLNTWESKGGHPAPNGHTGMYHVAFLYPTRAALANTLKNVLESGVELSGAADHGVSEALYLNDTDGNRIEIYRDRDPADWPRGPDGKLQMVNARLDVQKLLSEATA